MGDAIDLVLTGDENDVLGPRDGGIDIRVDDLFAGAGRGQGVTVDVWRFHASIPTAEEGRDYSTSGRRGLRFYLSGQLLLE